ncbi:MAG: hypothetical protein IKP29_07760 [Pseudobutyrivibrio sp.]|nr:hypothetical protein [Pseudobutyrivibrio sp.]
MNDFRYRLARFFQGRTGVDALGRTVTWVALILMIITMITHSNIAYLLAMACLIYSFWRMLSKNYQKRYAENAKFLALTSKLRFNFSQYRTYKVFKCPNCKQKLRVPRGRGKIQITCNRCRTQFIKKV